jgi:hypothetical protein
MKLVHEFEELTPERRPQDPNLDGTGLRFETLEHGGEVPDAMPQAIRLTDAEAGHAFMCRSRSPAGSSTAKSSLWSLSARSLVITASADLA